MPDDQRHRSQYFLVENMEVEHARRTETQLQKRAHLEEAQPIEYKFNINCRKIGDESTVPEASMIFNSAAAGNDHYLNQCNYPGLNTPEQADSAFDMKFLGPSSSSHVEKIKDQQKAAEELSNKMYMLTENM